MLEERVCVWAHETVRSLGRSRAAGGSSASSMSERSRLPCVCERVDSKRDESRGSQTQDGRSSRSSGCCGSPYVGRLLSFTSVKMLMLTTRVLVLLSIACSFVNFFFNFFFLL